MVEVYLDDILSSDYQDPDQMKYIKDDLLSMEDAEYKNVLIDHKKMCYELENGSLKDLMGLK